MSREWLKPEAHMTNAIPRGRKKRIHLPESNPPKPHEWIPQAEPVRRGIRQPDVVEFDSAFASTKIEALMCFVAVALNNHLNVILCRHTDFYSTHILQKGIGSSLREYIHHVKRTFTQNGN